MIVKMVQYYLCFLSDLGLYRVSLLSDLITQECSVWYKLQKELNQCVLNEKLNLKLVMFVVNNCP